MNQDLEKILCTEEELEQITSELAEKINQDYAGQKLLVIGILKGCVIFLSDIFRKLEVDCRLDFMAASSYGSSSVSSGNVKITKDISGSIHLQEYHVLMIEDILDTGNTLYYIKDYLLKKNPLSLRICTLFDKPSRREKDIKADYIGKEIKNLFIVGYGLDYDERYRNLPYVGVLKPEIYQSEQKQRSDNHLG